MTAAFDPRQPHGESGFFRHEPGAPCVVCDHTEFVKCPLCGDPERSEDIVGGVCLSCADGIAWSQNARRGAVQLPPADPALMEMHDPWEDARVAVAALAVIDVILLLIVLGVIR